jgi:hypothetical protein
LQLTDPKLKQAAERAFGILSTRIVKVEGELLAASCCLPNLSRHSGAKIRTYIAENVPKCYNWNKDALDLPYFYRRIHTRACSENITEFKDMLSPILKNNLILDRTGGIAGDGQYEGFFLCIEIDDDDLPWDHTQLDW